MAGGNASGATEHPPAPHAPPSASIYFITTDCMRCGVCEFTCPERAIIEARRQLIILKHQCNGCGDCVQYCPVRAIVRRARTEPQPSVR